MGSRQARRNPPQAAMRPRLTQPRPPPSSRKGRSASLSFESLSSSTPSMPKSCFRDSRLLLHHGRHSKPIVAGSFFTRNSLGRNSPKGVWLNITSHKEPTHLAPARSTDCAMCTLVKKLPLARSSISPSKLTGSSTKFSCACKVQPAN